MKTEQNRKLISVSVFYHNDYARGFAFTLDNLPSDFEKSIQETLNVWDLLSKEYVIERLDKLAKDAEHYGKLQSVNDAIITIIDICWLETRGHLKPDNFNGVQWMWQLTN